MTGNKTQWLEGSFHKVAMMYHGMDIIKKYQQDEKFQELFMTNSQEFFKDSPPHEKFQIPMQDSPGKLFMQKHGMEFLGLDLGKKWYGSEDGIRWCESHSGVIFMNRNKEDISDMEL